MNNTILGCLAEQTADTAQHFGPPNPTRSPGHFFGQTTRETDRLQIYSIGFMESINELQNYDVN
jgi:hypothetical protein